MKNKYWKGKKVLITGISGFVGGNLAKSLIEQKAEIYGLIRNEKKNKFLEYEGLYDHINVIRGDLSNKSLISSLISEEQIDSIFHLAAQVEVGVGILNPYLTFETNIRGTYNLLESVRQFPKSIKSIVIASSDKSYGSYPIEMMPYKEDYPLIPKYPYDTSKACADMIARAYASEVYNLPIVVTRFANIFGPGQLNFSAIIPDGIRSALNFSKFTPRSDGKTIRDFIYVDDVCDLYLRIGESIEKNSNVHGEIFNAGTNSPISIKEVVIKIFEKLNNKAELDRILKEMKGKRTIGEIDSQFMDYEKVNKFFKWEPRLNFDEGLDKTIDWYKSFLDWKFR